MDTCRTSKTGILKLDRLKTLRSGSGSSDNKDALELFSPSRERGPVSPQPSVDRLSVTWADPELSVSSASTRVNIFHMDEPAPSRDRFNSDSEEEYYSASISAFMTRRESTRRSKRCRGRRPSSPFVSDDVMAGRRTSVLTTSSGDSAGSMEEGQAPAAPVTQEQIVENIRLHKEFIGVVKQEHQPMRKKLKLVRQAKAYIKSNEGQLQERLAQSKNTRDIVAKCNILLASKWHHMKREAANLSNIMIPWELRIKEIESHFGSVVASYFTFLRWLFWVNLIITFVLLCFVIIPEKLTADVDLAGERKVIHEEDRNTSTNLLILWEFEGILKFSPLFYGYYTNVDEGDYRLPLAYFMTGLAVYVYSFVATLKKMAENSRMSKLSEKEDECIFSWKLFTGWDFMIGNAETAHNRTASIILSFKEALLEEEERKKDPRNWRITSLRILVNIGVAFLLAISAFGVVKVVERSYEESNHWWRKNEITLVMTTISNLFPMFFEGLGMLEHYHPRKQLRLQLARIMLLNLLNIYSLIFAQFTKIDGMTIELESLKPRINSPPINLTYSHHEHPESMLSLIFTTNYENDTHLCYAMATKCKKCNTNLGDTTTPLTAVDNNQAAEFLIKSSMTSIEQQNYNNSTEINSIDIQLQFNDSFNSSDELNFKSTTDYYEQTNNYEYQSTNSHTFNSTNEETIETRTDYYDKYNYMTTSIKPQTESLKSKTILEYDIQNHIKKIMKLAATVKGIYSEEEDYDSDETIDYTGSEDSLIESEVTSNAENSIDIINNTITEPDAKATVYSSISEITEAKTSTEAVTEKNTDNNLNTISSNNKNNFKGETIQGTESYKEFEKSSKFDEQNDTNYNSTYYEATFHKSGTISTSSGIIYEIPSAKTLFTSEEPVEDITTSSNVKQYQSIDQIYPCYTITCEMKFQNNSYQNLTTIILNTTGDYIIERHDNHQRYNLSMPTKRKLRSLCWETMFGQELVKLTMMDLVICVLGSLLVDFFRAVFVRYMNRCWCWDLEKKFPEYGDFKIAENILHLVNNQGMVWMGLFFSPGLAVLNLVKLVILMYLRSWAVMTCNVPHQVVFRASRSNNFYLGLLLIMLFLCVLPVGYAIVWVRPSWHCGPFSNYDRIYHIFTEKLNNVLPKKLKIISDYIASPGIVIPLLVLLILIIYYLMSLTNSLREANTDLKTQLRRERTEERRKMFQIADRRRRVGSAEMENTPFEKWKRILPNLPPAKSFDSDERKESADGDSTSPIKKKSDIFAKIVMALRRPLNADKIKQEKMIDISQIDDETDTEFHENLSREILHSKNIKLDAKIEKSKDNIDIEAVGVEDKSKSEILNPALKQKIKAMILKKSTDKKNNVHDAESQETNVLPKLKHYVKATVIVESKKRDKDKIINEKMEQIQPMVKADKTKVKQITDCDVQSKLSDTPGSVIPVITISKTESDDDMLSDDENAPTCENSNVSSEEQVDSSPKPIISETNTKDNTAHQSKAEESKRSLKRRSSNLKTLRRQSSVDSMNEQRGRKDKRKEDGHKFQYSL